MTNFSLDNQNTKLFLAQNQNNQTTNLKVWTRSVVTLICKKVNYLHILVSKQMMLHSSLLSPVYDFQFCKFYFIFLQFCIAKIEILEFLYSFECLLFLFYLITVLLRKFIDHGIVIYKWLLFLEQCLAL